MITSASIGAISKALVAAQKQITFASKDAVNPHLKSKYADLPSVIDAVKVALNDNGIGFIQTPGSMSNMLLTLTTRLVHESGEWIEDTMEMPLTKQDPQGYGSALTYARRYGLSAITGLYQDDDDGYLASKHAKATQEAAPKPQLPAPRFKGAIKAIQDGTYTAEKLRSEWTLSEDQELVLTDIGV